MRRKPHPLFFKDMAKTKNLIRRSERGDAGAEFSFITYTPFLLGLLIVGIFFGMLGFWRVGAGYSNLVGAQQAAVSSEGAAETTQRNMFGAWTNAGATSAGISDAMTQAEDRFILATFNIDRTFEFWNYDPIDYSIDSQIQTRLERFFPGAPKCDGDGCNE